MRGDPSFKVEYADKKNVRDAVVVIRPQDGLWRGTAVRFSVKFEPTYPHTPPAVLALDKLYHPNISLEGKVCLNILRVGHMSGGQDDGWKPVFTFYTIIMGLLTLFSAANPDDPLNLGALGGGRGQRRLRPRRPCPQFPPAPPSLTPYPPPSLPAPPNAGAAKEMRDNVAKFTQNVQASLNGQPIRIEVVDSSGNTRVETVAFPKLVGGGGAAEGGGAGAGAGAGGGRR